MSPIILILLGVLVLFVVGIAILAIGIYNALIRASEHIKKAWANIDVILKQRYDEVPQLIQICEQYATYEKSMIDKIMNAREQMVKGKTVDEKAEGFNALSAGISGLLAVGEAYPDLKANANFMQIQTRLSELEETIADRREYYNDSVTTYNIRIKQIPDVLFANMLGYSERDLFKVDDREKVVPSLKMNI